MLCYSYGKIILFVWVLSVYVFFGYRIEFFFSWFHHWLNHFRPKPTFFLFDFIVAMRFACDCSKSHIMYLFYLRNLLYTRPFLIFFIKINNYGRQFKKNKVIPQKISAHCYSFLFLLEVKIFNFIVFKRLKYRPYNYRTFLL